MNEKISRSSVICSVSRALLGEVSIRLRCVQASYDEAEIHLYCYFDGELQEADIESMQIVSGMVAGDFSGHKGVEHCIRLDVPAVVPAFDDRITIFLRKN